MQTCEYRRLLPFYFAVIFAVACSEPAPRSTLGDPVSRPNGTGGVGSQMISAGRQAATSSDMGGRRSPATAAAGSAIGGSSGMAAMGETREAGHGAVAGSSSSAGASATSGAGGDVSAPDKGAAGMSSETSSAPGELVEDAGGDCASSAGELKQNPRLPDPFAMHDGSRISSKSEWRCRRDEIKRDIEAYEIGEKPEAPMVEASLSGSKLNVKVTTSAGSITLSSTVTASAGSDCVAIGMNGPSRLIAGCVQIPFMHDQVVGYANDSSRSQSDPFYKIYPELWDKVSNYAAWSWGISRLIDGIVQMQTELKIDPKKLGVQGCSYAGKMALFAGALDERIALTIAQESGGGGINAWRTSQDYTKRTGNDIEKIDNTNYAWFLGSMKQLDPYSLPHDHHDLIAMIAPRALLALGNQDYEWLGDESGWKSINAAKEVWKALDVEDHIGFDFTSNHTHCAAAAMQVASATAFVDRFLKGQTADTNIVVEPQEGNLDLDFGASIDWDTPTLQ
jgi:hypothetical protein